MIRKLSILILLIAVQCQASFQYPERIIYEGETNALWTLPLDSYVQADASRRELWEQCVKNGDNAINCGRGYIATWSIKDDFLYLEDTDWSFTYLTYRSETNSYTATALHELLFPNQNLPIPAMWYSGRLRISRGKVIASFSYYEIYDKELYLIVDHGKVTSKYISENTVISE